MPDHRTALPTCNIAFWRLFCCPDDVKQPPEAVVEGDRG